MTAVFFPNIVRCVSYACKVDNSFYGYNFYKDQILLDCKNRCVFCDAELSEIGHEGFHLDHFRPQDVFPELTNDPHNLVISCSKCNRYKSKHWPIEKEKGVSYEGDVGFIEPFQSNRLEYFEITPKGELQPIKSPSLYVIELLNLNRPSRIFLRKKRMLNCKINELIDLAHSLLSEAISLLNASPNMAQAKIELAQQTLIDIRSIQNAINP